MPKVETKHFKQKGDEKSEEHKIHGSDKITMDDLKRAREDARKFYQEKEDADN